MTDAPQMKLGSIAPWLGSKRTLADDIIVELGKHVSYWELFCGSAAVLLAKKPCSQETINDLHDDLTNLAWVLADANAAAELYTMLGRAMFTESIFEAARQVLSNTPPPSSAGPGCGDIDRAYWYFLFSWMGRNGLAGTGRSLTAALAIRYTPGGGSPVTRFRSALESIPAWHYRLCNVLVLRRDAFALLPEIDDREGVSIYIDSPYLLETRSDGAAFEKGARYLHDFDSSGPAGLFVPIGEAPDPHDRLAAALQRFKLARVVVSYYEHPRLHTLYPGWTFRNCSMNKNMAAQNRRGMDGRTEAPEVLILNGASNATANNV